MTLPPSTVPLHPLAHCMSSGGPKRSETPPLKSFSIYCMRLTRSADAPGLCAEVDYEAGSDWSSCAKSSSHASLFLLIFTGDCSEGSFLCDLLNALLIFMLNFERISHLLKPELMWQHHYKTTGDLMSFPPKCILVAYSIVENLVCRCSCYLFRHICANNYRILGTI